MSQQLFVYLASILPLGVAAQWLAWRFRLPSILLLLALGFLLGQVFDVDALLTEALVPKDAPAQVRDETAVIVPEDAPPVALQPERLLFPFVSLAVAVILFEGGMTLRLAELRDAGRSVLQLCTVSALVTWALASLAAIWVLDLSWQMGLLLGAILVVTGPTVIAPLLQHVRPVKRVGSVAKWEGIVIDPVGAVLAVLVFTGLAAAGTPSQAAGDVALALIKTLLVGGVLGLVTGWLLVQLLDRFLVPDFLHNVFFLAALLAVFAASNIIQKESGLLTATVLGVYLGNQRQVPVRHVMQFKESLQVLLISTLFIVMSSRIEVRDFADGDTLLRDLLFLLVLVAVVRPVSVAVGMLGTRLSWRERTFLAFLAPRGIVAAAVASIFALEIAIEAGHSQQPALAAMASEAPKLVPITFIIIVGTVAVYGLSARPLARWLNLARGNPQGVLFAGAPAWAVPVAEALKNEGIDVLMVDTNYDNTARARMAGLPSVCASILSEYVQEDLDLSAMGRMFAVTSNDGVNALAAQEMTHVFGRKEVYQLTPWNVGEGRRASYGEHLQGRLLFGEDCTYSLLNRRFQQGYQVKKTTLTDAFTFDNYRQRYDGEAIVLFTMEDGELQVVTAEEDFAPAAGQKLIALVPPEKA